MIFCHHQGISWWGVKMGQVEVGETASLLEPSRLISCTQLVTSRPPRHFGIIPVDNPFLFLTTRCQTYKSNLESHDSLTFLKQGLLSGGSQRGKLQSEQRRLTCLCEPLETLWVFKWSPYIWGMPAPRIELGTGGSIICSKCIK